MIGGIFIELKRFLSVLFNTPAIFIHTCKAASSIRGTVLIGLPIVADRLCIVSAGEPVLVIRKSKFYACHHIAKGFCFFKPFKCFYCIDLDTVAITIAFAKILCSSAVVFIGCDFPKLNSFAYVLLQTGIATIKIQAL